MVKLIHKFLLVFILTLFESSPVQAEDVYSVNVGYQAGVNGSLRDFAYGGAIAGSEGGETLDSLEIHLVDAPYASLIEYRIYTSSGWSTWFTSFETATNNNDAILGMQIKLKDFPNANVYYQSYRKGLGWGIWVSNGQTSGTLSSSHPMTGFRVQVDEIGINYTSSIKGESQLLRHNGETQGTGQLETLSMNLISSNSGSVEYRAFLRNNGWTHWVKDGSTLGSKGAIIEALEARLIDLPQYSVQIQPQVEGEWWGYAYDGQTAGLIGSRLTAYRMKIVQRVSIQPSSIFTTTHEETSSPCPNSLGSDEIALWTNDNDIILETDYINNSQIRYESNIAFFDFNKGQDASISALLKDNDLSTASFDVNDIAYVCYGLNIASDLGVDYQEIKLNDASYDLYDLDYYTNTYSEIWYWYLFDISKLNSYEYNPWNTLYPSMG